MSATDARSDLRRRVDEALSGDADALIATYRDLSDALQAAGDGDAAARLQALLRELVEDGALARLRLAERLRAAVARLADAGPVSEIVERAPAEAASALELDRVLLSRVDDGSLVAEALFSEGDARAAAATLARLREHPVALGYPLVEGELLRRRRAALLRAGDGEEHATHQAHHEVMGWGDHLVAPVIMEGRVTAFLHADRRDGRGVGILERDGLLRFAEGFAEVYERAVLRRRLRIERQELRRIASWADARTAELSDGAIDLSGDRGADGGDEPDRRHADRSALRDLLTPRELDVLEHLVKGETNADIARTLVVSEGTVKFHVKNILRKMNAANRAEAISRYLRLSLRRDP